MYVFVLLLHGPWCQLRLSVQWNQTDGMGAGYSAIFLDLWVAHQIWGWSLHNCLWGSQQFSQPCDHQWFQIRQCNHASSSLLETWRWLWSMAEYGSGVCLSFQRCWYSWKHQPGHSCTPFWQHGKMGERGREGRTHGIMGSVNLLWKKCSKFIKRKKLINTNDESRLEEDNFYDCSIIIFLFFLFFHLFLLVGG